MSQERGSATVSAGVKLCHMLKRPDFDGYGFNLHSEKIKPGQFIGKVDANSPASEAGLKEGDRIVEVNGVPIGNETHKQVVLRIKAIEHEVRLLLIDADAGSNAKHDDKSHITMAATGNDSVTPPPTTPPQARPQEYRGKVQEMLAVSPNISSISLISSKRMSGSSSGSGAVVVPVKPPIVPDCEEDVVDRGLLPNGRGADVSGASEGEDFKLQQTGRTSQAASNNNSLPATPPPTLATAMSGIPTETAGHNKGGSLLASEKGNATSNRGSSNNNNNNKAGGLQLPMTAAEMRAKLLSKKKYDPKNENVDLKKKFEIIQKL